MLLGSCVSMRRAALMLGVHPITIARKLEYLSRELSKKTAKQLSEYAHAQAVQFDELQTIEHTKCKPLSVAMAVSKRSRKILGFQVSSMPATGHLARISRKKYGYRKDDRRHGLRTLFKALQDLLDPKIDIQSDQCAYYGSIVKKHFPKANYNQFKGQKGAVTGQGELKKTAWDPLFAINHTFAMLRANINRLVRRTWCTTKKTSRLIDHLNIYVWLHNNRLTLNKKAVII